MGFQGQRIQVQQTTHLFDEESVVIKHPFHPKTGKELKVIGICKPQGRETLRCKDVDGTEVLVPIGITNRGINAFQDKESTSSAIDFGYGDLVEALAIIDSIMCQLDYVAIAENTT